MAFANEMVDAHAVFIRKHARDTHLPGNFNVELQVVNHRDYEAKTTVGKGQEMFYSEQLTD